MPAWSHSRATTPGPGRGRSVTPGVALNEGPLDLIQSINLLTYRINSTAQDLFLGAQQPAVFTPLTCDQVIVGLAALQSAVSDLSRAYINHANTVLNRGPSSIDIGGLNSLLENGIFPSSVAGAGAGAGGEGENGASADAAGRAASPGARSVAGTKRKRVHDPNAPKRALTAYFLYMKHERANIAAELGANARPKEVADEGTRRWGKMPPQEKQKWKDMYAENLAIYNEEMSAYKASLPPGHKVDSTVPATPKPAKAAKTSKTSKPSTKEAARQDDDHDAAAEEQLQQAVREATTENSSSESDSSDSESADATPTPSPPKPTPKSQKRRQSKAAAAAAAAAPAPEPVIETPTPAPKKPSPEKKERKGKSKDKDRRASTAAVPVAVPSPAPEPPKSEKKPRKKRKSTVDE
ncbi:urease [Nannizzia gypsea CBS 118893]|uniref:Urease n=1 Tax=Arthroderma gypseum (strain ATCC MYA-4604 / CBS 118893) TaxID=535722 RepID=E4V355_ARTGP|nr:urease [Nannizzia gypsea CBS 118893]EFR04429.1 urease [Nannizzia gypsea CBS 118893]